MLVGQGKVGTYPVSRVEEQALALPELQGSPGEENREVADEVHIPDYVMHDFGFHRKIRGDQ